MWTFASRAPISWSRTRLIPISLPTRNSGGRLFRACWRSAGSGGPDDVPHRGAAAGRGHRGLLGAGHTDGTKGPAEDGPGGEFRARRAGRAGAANHLGARGGALGGAPVFHGGCGAPTCATPADLAERIGGFR